MELYNAAHSEKYFHDPLEFKPERWLRENRDEIHAFSANMQFGFGPRGCVGKKTSNACDLRFGVMNRVPAFAQSFFVSPLGRRVAELEMHVFMCKVSFLEGFASVASGFVGVRAAEFANCEATRRTNQFFFFSSPFPSQVCCSRIQHRVRK